MAGESDNTTADTTSTDRPFTAAIVPFTLGMIVGAVCWAVAGVSLGLFFGPLALALVIAPPVALAETSTLRRVLAGGAVVDGIGTVWLVAAIVSVDVTFVQWLLAYVTLLAVVAGFVGLAAGLVRAGLDRVVASMASVVVAMLWLASPVWLMPRLSETAVDKLIPLHPVFALNGIFENLGIWTQHNLAYRLTNLGQDVPYTLPDSPLACIVLHLLICTGGWLMARNARFG